MSALDRRNELLLILSARRKETVANLASELNVCERTISRDITHLSKLAPIRTVIGKNGGVMLINNYRYQDYKYYIDDKQSGVLDKVILQCKEKGFCELSNDEIECVEGIKNKYSKK